jgi:hypothetical protein
MVSESVCLNTVSLKRREEKVDDMRGAMPVIETDRHGRRLRSLLLE